MVAPAEHPQAHGLGPGRVSLSDSCGTEGDKSDRANDEVAEVSGVIPGVRFADKPHYVKWTGLMSQVSPALSPALAFEFDGSRRWYALAGAVEPAAVLH